MKGYIHSIETGGIVDGPGIRYVVFFQGCPLRCQYCHNPDTWQINEGKEISVDEIVNDILKYRSFIKHGGVTLSGGEPLLQAEFAAEILKKCKESSVHTAIDTSGIIPLEKCKNAVDCADLILLDIKAFDTAKCQQLTGAGNENSFRLLDYLREVNKDTWIRHVVVPGITDDLDELAHMASFLKEYPNVKRIEVIPFHKMGEHKWEHVGQPYKLGEKQEPSGELIKIIKDIFMRLGIEVV
jgi:pyruvate formate lyase activating enzyme